MSKRMAFTAVALNVLALFVILGAVLAQSGGGMKLDWWTVDGGGGTVAGGGYALAGTVGQHDAGALSAGGYRLAGGFWAAGGETRYARYLPLTMKIR